MHRHDIVVIGASAGGVEALRALARALPGDVPAALFVVLHIPPQGPSLLPQILAHAGDLPAAHAEDGERIVHGRIYVAPPDHHLLIERGMVRVTRGPRENRQRPAVDPLFRSAARAYGPRVVSVILSGTLDDGAAGAIAVKQAGGVSLAQSPDEALFAGMPHSVIASDQPDVLPVAAIAARIIHLAHTPVAGSGGGSVSQMMEYEAKMTQLNKDAVEDESRPGSPSPYACPECGGVLWELSDGTMLRYRCRVGHAYTADSLLADQSDRLEAALWAALRGLEEKASLSDRLRARAEERAQSAVAARFAEEAATAREHATVVRRMLLDGQHGGEALTGPAASPQGKGRG